MKCLDNFANIGKAAIIQSLGIQKNYTEEIETTVDAIDYSNTACSTCKYKATENIFIIKDILQIVYQEWNI